MFITLSLSIEPLSFPCIVFFFFFTECVFCDSALVCNHGEALETVGGN